MRLRLAATALAAVLATGCSATSTPNPGDTMPGMPGMSGPGASATGLPHLPTPPPPTLNPLPGMPAVTDPHDVDAAAGPGMLSAAVAADKPLVYVPHSGSGDVWVIDPATYQVIAKYPAGKELQHVVPSWDMRTLYATDDRGDHVLPFDPRTGQPGKAIPIVDPYNMYFTPDGRYAISVAERLRKLDWYDPHTWQVHDETATPDCGG
ncbi:MAG: hypothetical protein QOI78_5625, partial [Actinomycetota bacterium]|nr:hypothetical protein [Actinomycetota bacterium]